MKALVKFHQELVAMGYGLQVSTALQFWNKWRDQVSSTSSSLGNYVSFGPSNPNDPDAHSFMQRSGYLLDASGMNATFVTTEKIW